MTRAQGKLAEPPESSAAGGRLLYLARCRLTPVQTSQISPRGGVEGLGMMSARRGSESPSCWDMPGLLNSSILYFVSCWLQRRQPLAAKAFAHLMVYCFPQKNCSCHIFVVQKVRRKSKSLAGSSGSGQNVDAHSWSCKG